MRCDQADSCFDGGSDEAGCPSPRNVTNHGCEDDVCCAIVACCDQYVLFDFDFSCFVVVMTTLYVHHYSNALTRFRVIVGASLHVIYIVVLHELR